MKLSECYMCNSIAVSKEHVPAICFFPKGKRINLVKVPACKEHNEDTTKDDEYVRNIISMAKGNNQTGINHFNNKGIRSLVKNPKLLSLTLKNPKKMNWIKDDDSTKTNTYAVDRNRFDNTIRKIAYGIYYHTFQHKWDYSLTISTKHFVDEDYGKDDVSSLLESEIVRSKIIRTYGANPEVFQFVFLNLKENNVQILFMKFYESFEVWAIPKIDL